MRNDEKLLANDFVPTIETEDRYISFFLGALSQ